MYCTALIDTVVAMRPVKTAFYAEGFIFKKVGGSGHCVRLALLLRFARPICRLTQGDC